MRVSRTSRNCTSSVTVRVRGRRAGRIFVSQAAIVIVQAICAVCRAEGTAQVVTVTESGLQPGRIDALIQRLLLGHRNRGSVSRRGR